jgi:hypothetical protein
MICKANWVPTEELPPPLHRTVLLYSEGDLYPIVGSRCRGLLRKGDADHRDVYMLEEGGPEDGEHRSYPILTRYRPTHWCELPPTPLGAE